MQQYQNVNFMDGRPLSIPTLPSSEVLFSRPDGKFTIYEDDATLRVVITPELVAHVDPYLMNIRGGGKTQDTTGNTSWILPKGQLTEQILGAFAKIDIAQNYKKRAPIMPVNLPESPQRHHTNTSFPKPQSPIPQFQETTYSNPYGQIQLPQRGQAGFIPTIEKPPPKLIYSDPHTQIMDYSDKAVAVFLSPETYKEKGPYFSTIGKQTKLYPDGPNSQPRFGWIIAKSVEDSMTALSNIIGADIHTRADFSHVTKGKQWTQKTSAPAPNTSLTQFMNTAPILSMPLTAVDPLMIPGLSGNMPFVPEVKESVDSLVMKLMKMDITISGRKEDEQMVILWGNRESIQLSDEDNGRIKFDCIMGPGRIVCYSKQ